MKKEYVEPVGSSFPVGSPEYQKWLDNLEPVYRDLMLAEIRERARQASQKVKHVDQ
jgi:hypothetical protein